MAHLFSITSALAASPDIGWPDAFNSGLMVLTPSLSTFSDIRNYAITRGSWDGADQGLLNDYFGGDEASGEAGRGGGWQRLPFRYNVTPNAGYQFTPAYERYGRGIMTAHFIGANKPWNRPKPTNILSTTSSRRNPGDYDSLLLRWHQAYEEYYPASVAKGSRGGAASVVHTERGVEVVERPFTVPTYRAVWDAENDLVTSGSDGAAGTRPVRTRGIRRQQSAASLIRGAGQTDDLQSIFQSGVVAASIAAEVSGITSDNNKPNEGVYISLPLDGRISLMAPDLDSGAEEDSPDSDETIDASRWNRGQTIDLPPRQSTAEITQNQANAASGEWSPPKVSWDPAKEPPPAGGDSSDYQMRMPVDAFYINAWDQRFQPKGKAAFFEVSNRQSSTQGRTIARLQREHYFDNLGSEKPDPSLVRPVFPWESTSTTSSSRIFPDEESAAIVPSSRGQDSSLEAGSRSPSEVSSGTPNLIDASSSRTTPTLLSPTGGQVKRLPTTLNYTNAWDQEGAIGAKYDRRTRTSSGRVSQMTGEEVRSSRGTTQVTSTKQRNRHSQADIAHWEEGGSKGNRGMRDASADQSADGDNESSSSSEGDDSQSGTIKWRREGPGPGYQRKVEKHFELSGTSPRSPRQQQAMLAGGSGGSGGRGELTSAYNRSRSSSGASAGNSPNSAVPSTGVATITSRQRFRTDTGSGYTEEEAISPSLDMSLSSAYEASFDPTGSTQRTFGRWPDARMSPPWSLSNSAQNSGANTPTAVATPLSQSPVASRGDLRQLARSQAQDPTQEIPIGSRRRRNV